MQKSLLAAVILFSLSFFLSAQPAPCNVVGAVQYGQCPEFITCVIPVANATQGATVVYPVTVSNAYGAYPISVNLGAVCDANNLECVFSNIPYPNDIPAGEYRTYDLYAYTNKAVPGNYSIPIRITGSRPGYDCNEDAELALTVNPNVTGPVPETVGVFATLYPATVSARPGESVTFFVTLRNTLKEKTFATIESAGTNPFEASTRYSAVDVQLNPEETKVIEVEVTIPPGTPGLVAGFAFLVKTGACCYRDVVLPVQVVVHGPQLTLTLTGEPLSGQCLEAKYGEPLSLRLGVRNDGQVSGPFSFSLEATEAAKKFAFLLPRELEISPGDRQFLNVTFAPRQDTGFGTYYYSFLGEYVDYTVFRRDYCVRVKASEKVEVAKDDSYGVVRAATSTIPFSIKNVGSAACSFSLETLPQSGLSLNLVPNSFSLTPNQETSIDLVVGTTLATELNDYDVPVTLRSAVSSCNLTNEINFLLSVVSSNRSGESLLSIQDRDYTAVEEVSKTFKVDVSNKGSKTLRQVRLEVLGIPLEWVRISAPVDIPAGASRSFDLTLRPSQTAQRLFEMVVAAVSGRESVHSESSLTVEVARKNIDFATVASVPVQQEGATRETRLSVAVRNTGNVPASNIQPLLFSSEADELLLSTEPATLSLEPGQSATIQIVVKPIPTGETSEQQVELKLGSSEGASGTGSVKLPAMLGTAAKAAAPEFPWKILAIIVLLIAIFGILAREEMEKRAKAA